MNKAVLGAIISVVAVGGIVAVVASNSKSSDKKTSSSSQSSSNEAKDNNPFTNPASDQSSKEVQSGTVTMDIKGFAFAKKTIKVKKGTKVTWTNQDSAKHDITPDAESPDFKASELLAKGESYDFTFNTVGTYTYHCSPHPYMKASVEVVE